MMTAGMTGDLMIGILAGLALGALHLLWLWRASTRFGAEAGGVGALLAGGALRLSVVLSGFAAIASVATHPGLALTAALGSFVLARTLGLWRARDVRR